MAVVYGGLAPLSASANVCSKSLLRWNAPKPPSILPLLTSNVLVQTPVLCGNFPVKIDERDGQHSELVTK
jgi:hypothetical protein